MKRRNEKRIPMKNNDKCTYQCRGACLKYNGVGADGVIYAACNLSPTEAKIICKNYKREGE